MAENGVRKRKSAKGAKGKTSKATQPAVSVAQCQGLDQGLSNVTWQGRRTGSSGEHGMLKMVASAVLLSLAFFAYQVRLSYQCPKRAGYPSSCAIQNYDYIYALYKAWTQRPVYDFNAASKREVDFSADIPKRDAVVAAFKVSCILEVYWPP